MLEFYQGFADYREMMTVVEALLTHAADAVRAVPGVGEKVPAFQAPFPRIEWVPALDSAIGFSVLTADDGQLRQAATHHGIEKVNAMSRPKLLDELFGALVEQHIDSPTFVIDYPKELSPLAKPKRGNPELTERFELFARGLLRQQLDGAGRVMAHDQDIRPHGVDGHGRVDQRLALLHRRG